MNVAELIEKLSDFDPDLEIVIDGVAMKFLSIEYNILGEPYLELS